MTVKFIPIIAQNDTIKTKLKQCCSVDTAKKRIPIIGWLPKYRAITLLQDIIAGITVGLTAIAQGIAYAVIAGLPPEYGLYSGLVCNLVYCIFGSCKDVTVGPTAILAALVSKYVVNYSNDFAVLAAFLSGLLITLMGLLNLGFLVDFISSPVIAGFTMAAALQIASSQLKSLFGLQGSSGNYFAESVYNFFVNIKTARLWDPLMGFATIAVLFALKRLGQGCKRTDGFCKQLRWFISLARNAVVVILGMAIAFTVKALIGSEPLILIGKVEGGFPDIKLPPFQTEVRNETIDFTDMLKVFGPQSIVLPLVSILEAIAIAKAFSGGKAVDATQELIALGLCNIIGSFISGIPVTGSFTKTVLNNASGVRTTAGGIFNSLLVFLALSVMTTSFYFIPKASLAGLIITAMIAMMDFSIISRLWRTSKLELLVFILTVIVGIMMGLEYGIVAGVIADALVLLYSTSRPKISIVSAKTPYTDILIIPLNGSMTYCASEHVRRLILKTSELLAPIVIIDGTNLNQVDFTVVSNILTATKDIEKHKKAVILFNFKNKIKIICSNIDPLSENKFKDALSLENFINSQYGV